MSEDDATTQEKIFRAVYAEELKKKRDNELNDERRRVNYQEGKTPGRRGFSYSRFFVLLLILPNPFRYGTATYLVKVLFQKNILATSRQISK